MKQTQCKTCSEIFNPTTPTQAYCSRICLDSRGSEKYPQTKECQLDTCSNKFTVDSLTQRKKYCSHSCSAKDHNFGRDIAVGNNQFKCHRCPNLAVKYRKYCKDCHDSRKEWQLQEKVDKWLSGDVSVAESEKYNSLSKWARNYVIELSDTKCSECGWCTPNPVTGKTILTVDHIDGNWKNNKFDNLKVLCYNCHTLTPTFGNLNRGSASGMRPYAVERSRTGYTGSPKPKAINENVTCKCGNSKSTRASVCTVCYSKNRSSSVPSIGELKSTLVAYNLVFTRVGEHYGVSDNAVRKWCRKYGLPTDKSTLRELLTDQPPV